MQGGGHGSMELSDLSRLLTAQSAASGHSGLITSRSSFSTHRSGSQSTIGLTRVSSASGSRSVVSRSQELALKHMYKAQSSRPPSASSRESRKSRNNIDRLAQRKPIAATTRKPI